MLLRPDSRRTSADVRVVLAFLAGTLSGALLTTLVAWVLSGLGEPVPDPWRVGLLAVAGVGVWAVKHGPLEGRVQLPEARRQIPAEVFGGSLARGAYRFGFELATGVRTYAPSAAPYVLLLAVLLLRPELGTALLMGTGFAVGRAAPLAARLVRGRATTRRIDAVSRTPATVIVLIGGLSLV